ncbi:MAG: PaaI family thioesterase [Aggregatilineales bacterium]
MNIQNRAYKEVIRAAFAFAPFVVDLGMVPTVIEPGICESEMPITEKHLQHNGFIHGGVQATIADYTGAAAAGTVIAADQMVLTAEFKINFLRAGKGEKLTCKSTILKAGSHLSVVESEVYAHNGDDVKLISKAMVTVSVVPLQG